MDKRHFIFDIDGTLINTEKAIIKGLGLLLEVKGVPYEPDSSISAWGSPAPLLLSSWGWKAISLQSSKVGCLLLQAWQGM